MNKYTLYYINGCPGARAVRLYMKHNNIDVEEVLIVTINDILQEPGKGYQFPGGSVITFSEAPKVGDTCKILFFKGNKLWL